MRYDIYENYYDENEETYVIKKHIVDGEAAMLDLVFSLHEGYDEEHHCNKIMKKADRNIFVHQHVEIGDLVFNRKTHETRRVRKVDRDIVELYNSDSSDDCRQQDGMLGFFRETWYRGDIIVINTPSDHSYYFYRPATELGGYPKFQEFKRHQYMD